MCWAAICLHHPLIGGASKHSCSAEDLEHPGFCGNDECKWEMFCLQFSVWESRHIQLLSLLPNNLAPVGLHRSKRELVGVCLDPLFVCIAMCNPPIAGKLSCHENKFEINCSSMQLETDIQPRSFLFAECTATDLCAERTINKRVCTLSTSLESHWSESDAFESTHIFTVMTKTRNSISNPVVFTYDKKTKHKALYVHRLYQHLASYLLYRKRNNCRPSSATKCTIVVLQSLLY